MSRLKLSFACWNYDRTRALMDGTVPVDGIDLNYLNLPVEETFFRMARFQEFDVAEMSLSSYCVTLSKPERPFVALPIFPSRFFRHSCIYVNANSGIHEPKDLIGKRIASPEYQMTAPVWIRGILSDHYGVPVDAQPYLFGGEEEAGRIEKMKLQLPPNIQVSPIGPTQTLSKMLHDGELDALYTARMPSSFLKGDGKVKRLFENYVDVERAPREGLPHRTAAGRALPAEREPALVRAIRAAGPLPALAGPVDRAAIGRAGLVAEVRAQVAGPVGIGRHLRHRPAAGELPAHEGGLGLRRRGGEHQRAGHGQAGKTQRAHGMSLG